MARMFFSPSALSEIHKSPFDAVIDVRSPGEYAEDHIPGAVSLPVLNDRERAIVGTVYTREDRFKARKIGAALVARNAADHIERHLMDKGGGWRPLVYCWRGGQRSGAFASILSQTGWKASQLEGGYRSYRRLVSGFLYGPGLDLRLLLLDGNTGTAKTELLELLRAQGVQTVDLEGLASHRGSVFGATESAQPSQKGFESKLAQALAGIDPGKPVIMEAEANKIGNLSLPPGLWKAMLRAPRVILHAPLAERVRYLLRAYSDIIQDPGALDERIETLKPLRGGRQVEEWRRLARAGDFETLAGELITLHYDPTYSKSRSARRFEVVESMRLESLGAEGLERAAGRIAKLADESGLLRP